MGEVEHIGTRVRDSGFRKTRSRKRAGWEGWQFGGLSGVVCQFTGWPRERAAAQDQPSIRATSGERDWSCSIRYRWKTVGFCRSANGTRSPYVFFTSSRFSYHGSFSIIRSYTYPLTCYNRRLGKSPSIDRRHWPVRLFALFFVLHTVPTVFLSLHFGSSSLSIRSSRSHLARPCDSAQFSWP